MAKDVSHEISGHALVTAVEAQAHVIRESAQVVADQNKLIKKLKDELVSAKIRLWNMRHLGDGTFQNETRSVVDHLEKVIAEVEV